jgi:hypothetical protein
MESNYKRIYQGASSKDLEHSQHTLISDIDAAKYELEHLQEFSEQYLDLKREISEMEYELKYVEEMLDLYNESQLNGLENQSNEE